MADYDDILDRSWDDFKEPPMLPLGSYMLKVRNISYKAGDENKSGRVTAFLSVQEPMDDVDAAALAEFGDDFDITQNEVVKTFWVDRDRDWVAVKDFLRLLGVEPDGQTLGASFKAARNAEVVAYLDQREFTDRNGNVKNVNEAVSFARPA